MKTDNNGYITEGYLKIHGMPLKFKLALQKNTLIVTNYQSKTRMEYTVQTLPPWWVSDVFNILKFAWTIKTK